MGNLGKKKKSTRKIDTDKPKSSRNVSSKSKEDLKADSMHSVGDSSLSKKAVSFDEDVKPRSDRKLKKKKSKAKLNKDSETETKKKKKKKDDEAADTGEENTEVI